MFMYLIDIFQRQYTKALKGIVLYIIFHLKLIDEYYDIISTLRWINL